MVKKIVPLLLVILFLCVFPTSVFAQIKNIPQTQQLKATIIKEIAKDYDDNGKLQKVTYSVQLDNPSKSIINADFQPGDLIKLNPDSGSQVIVAKIPNISGKTTYQIIDSYRIPALLYFLVAFVILAILIVGRRGIGSLLGLIISLLVILYGIVPLILKGYDPLTVTIFFSFIILLFTTYLAHGVSKQTTIALSATFVSLLLTLGISYLCIKTLNLNGFGNENVYDLYYAIQMPINAKGLLLSGIIIATLGALNDVTITQTVTIFEMKKIDKSLDFLALIKKGINIGREHGASMVNTLVLAYAGSSLFIFIFFIINPQKQPMWAIFNNEFFVEEVVKTLGGTMGILLSVPIVTLLAAYAAHKKISPK